MFHDPLLNLISYCILQIIVEAKVCQITLVVMGEQLL